MLKLIIGKINTEIKILISILIILMLLISRSIYLILFFSTLIAIIIILNENIKKHILVFRKIYAWILIILIFKYIILGGIISTLLLLYKLVLIILLVNCLVINNTFDSIHYGIYKLLKIFKFKSKDTKEISFNICIYIYSIYYYLINCAQIFNPLQKLVYISSIINEFKLNLKLNFYKLKKEKYNNISTLFLILFIVLFLLFLKKEVIL